MILTSSKWMNEKNYYYISEHPNYCQYLPRVDEQASPSSPPYEQ